MQNDNIEDLTLYTVDEKHYYFKNDFARIYSTSLEVIKVDETIKIHGKVVFVKEV